MFKVYIYVWPRSAAGKSNLTSLMQDAMVSWPRFIDVIIVYHDIIQVLKKGTFLHFTYSVQNMKLLFKRKLFQIAKPINRVILLKQ